MEDLVFVVPSTTTKKMEPPLEFKEKVEEPPRDHI
jgi:hypothetical protein